MIPLIDLVRQLVTIWAGLVDPVSKVHTKDLSEAADDITSLPGSPSRIQVSPLGPVVPTNVRIKTWLKAEVEDGVVMAEFAASALHGRRNSGNLELEITGDREPTAEAVNLVRDRLNAILVNDLKGNFHG